MSKSVKAGEKVENRGIKCRDQGESGKPGNKVPGPGEKWKNRERSVRFRGEVAESGMKCQKVERYDAG